MASRFSWKLGELVTVVVLAVALGVLWWGWTFFTALFTPLKAVGLDYLFVGMWLTGGTLIPFLVRRPGVAFIGEVLAAVVEGFITQWGITAVLWGLVQGLGAELVFALFRYRTYNLLVLVLAGAVSGILSWMLDFVYSNYLGLAHWIWAVQAGSVIIGGAFWAGFLAWLIGRGVLRTGVLQSILPDATAPDATE
jgi:energy-coupling factor transport system substrate-specific component